MAGVNGYTRQAATSAAAVDPQHSVYHGRPEKSIILAAGRKSLAEGKFGGFQEGEMQPLSKSATGGQQSPATSAKAASLTRSSAKFAHSQGCFFIS